MRRAIESEPADGAELVAETAGEAANASLKTLGQHRAAFAWACVQDAANRSCLPEYSQFCSSIPALIHNAGLGHAVAFLRIQSGGKALVLTHLETWLMRPPIGTVRRVYHSHGTLDAAIFEGTSLDLRRATQEAQALLVWMKRFSKAEGDAAEAALAAEAGTADAHDHQP